jgi:hypothetical protein
MTSTGGTTQEWGWSESNASEFNQLYKHWFKKTSPLRSEADTQRSVEPEVQEPSHKEIASYAVREPAQTGKTFYGVVKALAGNDCKTGDW